MSNVFLAVVQLLSYIQLFVTSWNIACQVSLSIISQSLLKLMSIESVITFNHLILCRPLLLSPSIFPSIKVFSNESTLCLRWPKYQSFSFNIIPSKEIPGLISFRMDWLDLLAVEGTLKSLLQHHSSKASVLRPGVQHLRNPSVPALMELVILQRNKGIQDQNQGSSAGWRAEKGVSRQT